MTALKGDQADGLRHLMANSPGQKLAVVASGPAVGATSVAHNLAAALRQLGRDVLLHDERRAAPPTPAQCAGKLLLVDTVLDPQGALSPWAAQADHVMVVLQPSATSIKAAYACVKNLHYAHALQRVRMLVNHATDASQAERILANLAQTSGRYLAMTLESAGWVRADPRMPQAQRLNLTVVEAYRTSPAAIDFFQIAADMRQWPWRSPKDQARAVRSAPAARDQTGPTLALH
jgi:flagellar biosynthesis protein FlhG